MKRLRFSESLSDQIVPEFLRDDGTLLRRGGLGVAAEDDGLPGADQVDPARPFPPPNDLLSAREVEVPAVRN